MILERTRYPDVVVSLLGRDLSEFEAMRRVRDALVARGVQRNELNEFTSVYVRTPYDQLNSYLKEWVTLT